MGRSLGDLEQLMLFALLRLGGEASSVDVLEEIEGRAGRAVSPGALYNVMHRLEGRGLVVARTGEETPARGGRRRKRYRLTTEGRRALATAWRQVRNMADGFETDLLDETT